VKNLERRILVGLICFSCFALVFVAIKAGRRDESFAQAGFKLSSSSVVSSFFDTLNFTDSRALMTSGGMGIVLKCDESVGKLVDLEAVTNSALMFVLDAIRALQTTNYSEFYEWRLSVDASMFAVQKEVLYGHASRLGVKAPNGAGREMELFRNVWESSVTKGTPLNWVASDNISLRVIQATNWNDVKIAERPWLKGHGTTSTPFSFVSSAHHPVFVYDPTQQIESSDGCLVGIVTLIFKQRSNSAPRVVTCTGFLEPVQRKWVPFWLVEHDYMSANHDPLIL